MEKMSENDIQDVTSKAGLNHKDLENLILQLNLLVSDVKHFKYQAASVLETWHRIKGQAATKQALITALEKCGCYDAVDYLKEKWGLTTEGTTKAVGML